jgi:hypothetical protein
MSDEGIDAAAQANEVIGDCPTRCFAYVVAERPDLYIEVVTALVPAKERPGCSPARRTSPARGHQVTLEAPGYLRVAVNGLRRRIDPAVDDLVSLEPDVSLAVVRRKFIADRNSNVCVGKR